MWGPYASSWRRLKEATSRRFRRGRISQEPDPTSHPIQLRARGRHRRLDRSWVRRLLAGAFALSIAAGLLALSWRLTEGADTRDRYLAPFAIVALYVTMNSDLKIRWKLTLTAVLLLVLVPVIL